MINIDIYDTTMHCVGTIDNAISILWCRKLIAPSLVQIEIPYTSTYLACIKQYYTLVRTDTNEAVLIRTISIHDNIETGTCITLVAYDYTTMFYKRAFSMPGATVYAAITNNTQGNRAIPNMALHNDLRDIEITKQHEMLGDSLELSMAYVGNWGLQSILVNNSNNNNNNNKEIQIKPIVCTDHSISQTVQPHIIFARKYDNFEGMTFTVTDDDTVNTVICSVNTDGVDDPQNIPTNLGIDINRCGFNRSETHVVIDAAVNHVTEQVALRNEIGAIIGNVTIDHMYTDVEKTRENAVNACKNRVTQIENIAEGTITPIGYRVMWDLGDRVTIIGDIGVNIDTQITDVTEYYDNTDNRIVPTFGTQKLTVADKIRKMGVL